MVMCECWIIKQVHKDSVIIQEGTDNVRVREAIDGHGPVIQAQQLGDVQLLLGDLLFSPACLAEPAHPEQSVVEVGNSKLGALGVLLDLFQFDVLVLASTDFLLESLLVGH